jgi:hypothetical protein
MKKKRSLIRTMWLMWVRYIRWSNNPKNWEIVALTKIYNPKPFI